jgi:hypothetical protein
MDASTIAILVIGIAGAAAAAALVLRSNGKNSGRKKVASTGKSRAAKSRTAEKAKSPPGNRYKATSIICGENACAAVRAIQDKRFLVRDNDIPQIPLPGCDVKKCTCVYAHHKDRREEEHDRRGPRGLRSDLHSHSTGSERRAKRGRRKSDFE